MNREVEKESGRSLVELGNRLLTCIYREVTPQTVRRLLFTRRGEVRLLRQFPSKRVREWAFKVGRRYGIKVKQPLIYDHPLYAVMRRIYKELEFDCGYKTSLEGFAFSIYDIDWGVTAYLETNGYDCSYGTPAYKYKEKLVKKIEKFCEVMVKCFTGGLSLGALRWYEAMGRPSEIPIYETDEKGNLDLSSPKEIIRLKE